MEKNLKILGLSLLALTAMMAVSATAAQAKWVLKRNNVEVTELKLKATVEAGEFLVPNVGIKVNCEDGGKGSATATLNGTKTELTGSASLTFHKCTDLEFGAVCDVHSLGQPNGLIAASGSGKAFMEGEKVGGKYLIKTESTNFSTIVYLHKPGEEECPLEEVSLAGDIVSGSIALELLTPETEAALHVIDIAKQNLVYGTQPAVIHKGKEGEAPKGSVTEENGATFSIKLTGL